RTLGWSFCDCDVEIQRVSRLTIDEIFGYFGENYFRQLETAVLKKVVQGKKQVIATGGGAVLATENIGLLKQAGPVVLLTAPVDVIIARASCSDERPLLKTAALGKRVRELLAKRQGLYQATANFTVDTADLNPEQVAHVISTWLKANFQLAAE
ncbi:MAG: shikimate kinase, partial [Firmicutes bacterium]|nr:shikimate kinase [Bacillota bacterium]